MLDTAPAIIWTAHDPECGNISGNREAFEFLQVRQGVNLSKSGLDAGLLPFGVFHEGNELEPEAMPIQITARTGREPGEHYRDLAARFGAPLYTRIDAPATPEEKARLAKLSPEAVKHASEEHSRLPMASSVCG